MKYICEIHAETTRSLDLKLLYFQFLKIFTFHLHHGIITRTIIVRIIVPCLHLLSVS